jgi:3-oxoadipate enol-lactonase
MYETGVLTRSENVVIPYVMIGNGSIPVVVLPGISDGATLVTDDAARLAKVYRKRVRKSLIVILSRRFPLPADFSNREQADDLIWAVEKLGLGPAIWECHWASGPVGQWVAVKRPDLVRGLILSDSLHRTGEHTRKVIEDWLELIRQERWGDYAWSKLIYTTHPERLQRLRLLRPLLLRTASAPKYPERLARLLSGMLELDQRALLPEIDVPAVVLGGQIDRVVPAEIQREMADLITSCRIKLFPGYGHANADENPLYFPEVDRFIQRVWTGPVRTPGLMIPVSQPETEDNPT